MEIPVISSHVARASSLRMSSPSHARSSSCNSSTVVGVGITMAGLGGGVGGRGLLKANTDKSNIAVGNTLTCRKEWLDTYLPTAFTQWSPATVVIRWGACNSCHEEASHDHRHEPSL
jgi:hypothetical protein